MKKSLVAILPLIALSVLMLPKARGAEKEGNGGGAFICSGDKKSEFLDLYEARRPTATRPALNIVSSSAPVEDQIQGALDKLKNNPLLYNAILQEYQLVRTAPVTLPPPGQNLAWPSDETNQYVEAGCQAIGIVIFHDYPISMDLDVTNLGNLPNTDQAAAWVHETIYRYLRITQPDRNQNSANTRAIVGYLFSDETGDQLKTDLQSLHFIISPQKEGLRMVNGEEALYTPGTVPLYPASSVPIQCWYTDCGLASAAYQTLIPLAVEITEGADQQNNCPSFPETNVSTTLHLTGLHGHNDELLHEIYDSFSDDSPKWQEIMDAIYSQQDCLVTFALTDTSGDTALFEHTKPMVFGEDCFQMVYPGKPEGDDFCTAD